MEKSIFDKEIDRTKSKSDKWNKYKDKDIIPMWVADMDFEAPKEVIEAIKTRADHGVFGYTPLDEETLEAFVDFIKRHYGWEIKKEWVIFSYGVVISMNFTCKAVNSKDVIINTPVYPHFYKVPKNAGSSTIEVPMIEKDDRWCVDFDKFEKSITENCKLFMLCNPHNPGGTLFTKEELERFADIAKRHDLVVCSDEIHADLILNPNKKHIPIASLNENIAQQSITLLAPSKTFNIAGLKNSFVIIPNDSLRRAFKAQMRGLVDDPNIFASVATKTAYKECDYWLEELREYLRDNLKIVQQFAKKNPKLKLLNQDATFLAWIDTKGLNHENPHQLFLDYGVGLSEGEPFGDKSFVRLNFGTTKKTLKEALKRMQKAIDSLV